MSTLVERTLYLNPHESQQYATNASSNINWTYTITADGSNRKVAVNASLKADASVVFDLNSTAMGILYPNSAARPTKATIQMSGCRSASLFGAKADVMLYFNGGRVYDENFTSQSTETVKHENLTDSVITGSTKGSTIKVELKRLTGYNSVSVNIVSGFITLFFNQYSFSASGENCSAQVSSATGFDGDTVTYSCTPTAGAVFNGWYNGSTLVSTSQTYTHTVSGSDLTLTAKATVTTSTLTAAYGGRTILTVSGLSGNQSVSYNGQTIATLAVGNSKTLNCSGKVMKTNISVAGKNLLCAGKIMATNVALHYGG